MINNKQNLIFPLLLSALLMSCETVVDIDVPEEEPKAVINAMFEADEPVKAEVTKSSTAMEKAQAEAVEAATVVLFKNGESVDTLIKEDVPPEPGVPRRYVSENYTPEAGNNYRIEVEAEGLDPASAETRLPEEIGETELISYEPEYREALVDEWHKVVVEFPLQEDSYYTVTPVIIYEDQYGNSTSEGVAFLTSEPRLLHAGGGEFDQILGSALLSGEIEMELKEDDDGMIELELYPEAMPSNRDHIGEYEYQVIIRKVTSDYKNYIRTLRKQDLNRDNPFAERVSVYSNVEQGFGMFSGYHEERIKLEE